MFLRRNSWRFAYAKLFLLRNSTTRRLCVRGLGWGLYTTCTDLVYRRQNFLRRGKMFSPPLPPPWGPRANSCGPERWRGRALARMGGGASGRQGGEPPVGGPDPESRLTAPIGADRV